MANLSNDSTQSHSTSNPSICVRGANAVGSRLSITVQQASHGFVPGMALRWNSGIDGNTVQYEKAIATSPYKAEVVGIVGSVLNADSFDLVMSGVVEMNTPNASFFGQSIGSGLTADDVFFLSGTTAGWLTTTRPSTAGHVAKPIITRLAEDAQNIIYGVVTNYVGSHIGGNAAVSLDNLIPAGTIQAYAGDNPPSGWALCDGDGSDDNSLIPGIPINDNIEYYDNVGLKYGWVEAIKCIQGEGGSAPFNQSDFGSIVYTQHEGYQIGGTLVGVSGDYVFVRQSATEDIADELNTNFVNYTNETNTSHRIRGEGNRMDITRTIIQNPEIFPRLAAGHTCTLQRTDGTTESFLSYTDASNVAGVYSLLAPDLRGRTIIGAKKADTYGTGDRDTQTMARSGGSEFSSLDHQQDPDDGPFDSGVGIYDSAGGGWAESQTNLPPYLTTNWIIRTSSTAYAAITDKLSVKTLLLTGLPTSGSGEDQYTVYHDETDNSLKIQPDAP